MAQTKISTGVQPWLNEQETNALKSHVKEWEKIFKAAAREAKILAPKMDTVLLKQCKEKYQQWFHNHKKVQANFKAPSKLQKKWTAHQVIKEECKAEIFQQIHEEIKKETRQKAVHKEAKTARKKGKKMVKSFAKDIYIQAGMRVFVLGFWKDEKSRLLTSEFDFNEQLSKGSSFIKCKDWQVPKPYHEFDLDHLGLPMFPEINGLLLETKKAMIQLFLTIHYTSCHRKILWKAKCSGAMEQHHEGQLRFISSTYLPDDAKILEPSKMLHKDANAILHF
ncbi:hypothetical protein BDR04DRAFT_1117915 [Suillus decipiens]|nr:hypothetical protein BDR04DRAFT_1117915 [Suillus decipiens]